MGPMDKPYSVDRESRFLNALKCLVALGALVTLSVAGIYDIAGVRVLSS